MNLLHVGNGFGVSPVISNICNKHGINSDIIALSGTDKFGHNEYYNNIKFLDTIQDIQDFIKYNHSSYDHIVYHDAFRTARYCDSLHIPSSFMFHSNVDKLDPKMPELINDLESIDNMFVTNESLMRRIKHSELFCTPIDMDLFKPLNLKKKDVAFSILQEDTRNKVYSFVREKDSDLGIFSISSEINKTKYAKMPKLLNSFRYYVDIRYNNMEKNDIIRELSTIGRQALACGIPVLSYNGWNYTLSPSYYDENVAREFIRIICE